ncbi:MAG: M23 family metallopeptidase [Candidatus Lernaella stagnicola]|nr:M23 family metallopeptidase [Candidatus Lernaella stagnicola]
MARRSTFLALLVVFLSAGPALAGLIYPLDAPPSVSSNYGQYRHGHAHLGLDLWTFHRLGTPVRAVDDGVIYRIKCSPYGYGKVLYQRLRDGRTAVYGHLDGFAPKIAAQVEKRQRARGGYRLDWTLNKAEALSVEQGEIIGFAGDAGTDVSHLHFEIRGASGRPLNPLRHDFPLPDDMPPVIRALRFVPLSFDSLVDGDVMPKIVPIPAGGDVSPVEIAGRVGVEIEAYDRQPRSDRDLAPAELHLQVDGRDVFRHRFTSVGYGQAHISALSYDTRLASLQRRFFIRMYRLFGSTAFHQPSNLSGKLDDLSPGSHQITVTALDEKGNRTVVLVPIRVLSTEAVAALTPAAAPSPSTDDTDFLRDVEMEWRRTYAVMSFTVAGGVADDITFAATVDPPGRQIKTARFRHTAHGKRHHLAVHVPRDRNATLRIVVGVGGRFDSRTFRFAVAKSATELRSPDGRARLSFPAASTYDSTLIRISESAPRVPAWAAAVGKAYSFGEPWEPLRKKPRLTIHLPPGVKSAGLGLYLFDRGTWWHLEKGHRAAVPLLGTYALLRDVEAPEIGEMLVEKSRRPWIRVFVTDRGSGISDRAIRVALDGKAQIVEFQPYKKQFRLRPAASLAPGRHTLSVALSDRAGNRANRSFSFDVLE